MKRPIVFSILIVALVACLPGCKVNQPSGPIFEGVTDAPPDQALLYVYRPRGESFGDDRRYALWVDGEHVDDLLHGSYVTCTRPAGRLTLTADVVRGAREMVPLIGAAAEAAADTDAARLALDVQPGRRYWIRFHPEVEFTHFVPTLARVSEEEAIPEVEDCRRPRVGATGAAGD